MPVQMIELEEVTMVEANDETLEALVGRGGILGMCGSECMFGGKATC